MDGREEFTTFVDRHSRSLQRTAWLLTADWQAVEDLVQLALLTTWQRWNDVRDPDARLAYVRQVLTRTFLRSRRRLWRGEFSLGWQPDSPIRIDHSAAVDTADPVLRAVRALPAAQRAVIVLRYFDDQSERLTAQSLGCSVGTVKSQTARALATLRAVPELQDTANEGTA